MQGREALSVLRHAHSSTGIYRIANKQFIQQHDIVRKLPQHLYGPATNTDI